MENCSKSNEDLVRELRHLKAQLSVFKDEEKPKAVVKQRQEQDQRIKHVLLSMHRISRLIMSENDPKSLIRLCCEHLNQELGYYNSWIALLDENGSVKATAASSGCKKGVESLRKHLEKNKFPSCMTEALQKEGTVLVTEPNPDCCPDCSIACTHEDRVGMACRIEYGNRIYGVLVAAVPKRFGHNEEERKLFGELARDMGFALYKIEASDRQREQEFLLAAVYQNTPLIMILLDDQRKVRRINRLACEYLGRPSSEMLGRPCGEVLHCLYNQDDPKGCGFGAFCSECKVRMTVIDTLETGRDHHDVEAVLPFEIEGNEKNIDLLLYTTRIQFQKQHMVLVTILDISERKRSEIALKDSEQLFRSLIEGAPDAVFVQHGNRFVYLNSSAVSLFGGDSTGQFIGEDVMGRFHPDSRQALTSEIQTLTALQKPFHAIDLICVRLDGSLVPVELSAVPINFHGKRSALVFVRDITERRKAEEERLCLEKQIRQTQRLESLGVLAGGIAHDFNNILMIVMGHAELTLEKVSSMSNAHENIQEIINAAHRAADLCRQMLAYAGKAPSAFEVTDLSLLINQMTHLIQNSISNKTLLDLQIEPEISSIHADRGQIRQIVMNLIMNASEAIGDQKGVITVKTGVKKCDQNYLAKTALDSKPVTGMYVYLEITDTGCGIEADKKDRIFDPFYSTKFTGRGLGLAAVIGIVQTHRGAIDVYSEPGKGTTIKVLFPAMENNRESSAKKKLSETAKKSDFSGAETILLVDDEKSLLDLGTNMLEVLGFKVLTASDGLEAVEIYRQRQNEIDLVLMDLTMPRMDGAEAFSRIYELNPAVRVVLVSGYSEEDISLRFAGSGLAGVLQKPYTFKKLEELISKIIHEKG
jgi:PAS domain S-box-containing protein